MTDTSSELDGLEEVVAEFLVESHENLDQLDRDLVALEREPGSRELLSSIFRTIHTIKGTSGFLAFSRLEAVTHVGEALLVRLRDGQLTMNPEIADVLLRMTDAVRAILGGIEADGHEPATSHDALVAALTQAAQGVPPQAEAPAAEAVPVVEVVEAPPAPEPQPEPQPGHRSVTDSSIRVDVALLEQLMRLVGELVLTRNQVVQHASAARDTTLIRAAQRLNVVAAELQEGVMKTRMQPIDTLWSKLPRVVRDLGHQCGKQVRLEMEGRETELDRTLLEAVKDPLTHIVRNSVDHGIETPEERAAAGKPAEGTLTLRARHGGGQVVIEVIDDGKGIDPDKVAAKAIERGIVTAEQVAKMSRRDVLGLVFRPGFSTAAQVTQVSGRGVGMDVVKTNIERIGGTVDLSGEPGKGTTVRLTLPLTLAIIPALIVTCGGELFAVPQASLLELVRLDPEDPATPIEKVAGAPVYRLRGRLLPLVRLTEVLGLTEVESGSSSVDIVVLQCDGMVFGLVVDGVRDTQEIVVKPLGRQLGEVEAFAGATIMGDGAVSLILDVTGLSRVGGLRADRLAEVVSSGKDDEVCVESQERQHLLCGLTDGRRVLVPLDQVARLEEFSSSVIEQALGRDVVQYRGGILPLVHVDELLSGQHRGEPETFPVVVVRSDVRSAGLVVSQILDVVDHDISTDGHTGARGLRGSSVVHDRVTDVVDVTALCDLAGIGSPS